MDKIFNINVYFSRNNSCYKTSYFLIKANDYDTALDKFLNVVKDDVFDDGINVDDFKDWNFTVNGDYSKFTQMKLYVKLYIKSKYIDVRHKLAYVLAIKFKSLFNRLCIATKT